MSEEDVKRQIEFEAPGMGVVDNEVSEVVCYRRQCDERIPVDPATLVPEDPEAVDVEARDPEMMNTYQVEIYCSSNCRDEQYGVAVGDVGRSSGGGEQ